jgi:uncharacterized membrane protein YuzA (DUF378 family)
MAKKLIKIVNKTSLFLVSLGALNWLLLALANFDLVTKITSFVNMPYASTWIYSLIGIAGAWIGILALMGKVKIQ